MIGEAREAPRQAARQDDRAARARVQAEHRRHARGAVARARLAAARRGRRGARLGSGRATRSTLAAGRRASATACSRRCRRRRRGDRDRVGRAARRSRSDGGAAARCARPVDRRRPQPASTRSRRAWPASPTRGSGAPASPTDVATRDRRARRQSRARAVAWKRSSWPAARPSVSATPRAAGRRRSSSSPAGRWPRYQVEQLAAAGVDARDRQLRGRAGRRSSRRRSAGLGAGDRAVAEEPEPLGRGGGIRFAAQQRRRDGRHVRAQRRRARRRRLRARCSRYTGERGGRRDDHRRAAALAVRRRRPRRRRRRRRASARRRGSTSGSAAASTSSARRRSSASRTRGDHETTTFPELAGGEPACTRYRHEGIWLTVNTPEGAAGGERVRRRPPGVAWRESHGGRFARPWPSAIT